MKRRSITTFGTAVVLGALVACSSPSEVEESASENSEVEQEQSVRDELNIAQTAQPPTLDTAQTVSAVALDIAGNIYQQLFQLDGNYERSPCLAESYELSDDGKTYTIALREGVQFHNGEEMTAEDVVASMNRWLTVSSRAKELLDGATFTEVDPYTVELIVEQATSDVLILLASQAQFPSIMPKEFVESASADGFEEYVGTGPYQFDDWQQDQYIRLVRNDDFQSLEGEPSGFTGEIKAPTETLTYHFVSDHFTRISGLQTGLYDIADSIPLENYDLLEEDESIEIESVPGGTLTAFFNTNEGVLSDEELRHVVLAALDNEEIMLASYPLPELFSLAPGYLNENQEQWATDAGADYYNQADPDLAKQLLEESSYDGEEITILTTPDYNEMYNGSLVIQEQLRNIGMNVSVDTFDFATFLETKDDHSRWDLFLASTGYQLTPPQLLAVTPEWAGLDDEQVRSGLMAVREAASQEEAAEEWANVQQYLYEIGSSTVLGHYDSFVAVHEDVEGFELFEAPVVWNASIKK
ncbi:LOW QUALITY PROTEIN: peptide ABC transporter, periplasmic peptide-binding protein [Geomicrobium sp. JCM 19055]|nr:LOW QUALITY PROTEIN: peptide ABC transporter, periplasmic peptide-binding protein [Geomicrobium sp. JCM 19055]